MCEPGCFFAGKWFWANYDNAIGPLLQLIWIKNDLWRARNTFGSIVSPGQCMRQHVAILGTRRRWNIDSMRRLTHRLLISCGLTRAGVAYNRPQGWLEEDILLDQGGKVHGEPFVPESMAGIPSMWREFQLSSTSSWLREIGLVAHRTTRRSSVKKSDSRGEKQSRLSLRKKNILCLVGAWERVSKLNFHLLISSGGFQRSLGTVSGRLMFLATGSPALLEGASVFRNQTPASP